MWVRRMPAYSTPPRTIVTMPAMTRMTAISQSRNSTSSCTRASGRKNAYQVSRRGQVEAWSGRGLAIAVQHGLYRRDHAPRDFGNGSIAVHCDESAVLIEPLEEGTRLVVVHVES